MVLHPTIRFPRNGKALVVLGMHRSGTSALSGCLSQLGVNLGSDLLPAIRGENDRGFWEQRAIVAAHEMLLSELGSSWDDVRALPPNWWERPAAVKAHVSLFETLLRDVIRSGYWGVKDPRMCRLLPLWQKLFARSGVEPCFVIVLRHPWEVFASLDKRNGFSRQKTGLMYLHHMVSAEKETRNRPRAFVQYDELLQDPAATLLRISETLGLGLESMIDASRNQLSHFVSTELRHHAHQVYPLQTGVVENDDRIMDMVLAVHGALQKLGAGVDTDALEVMDRFATDLAFAADDFPAALNEHISQIVHRSRDVMRYAVSLEREVHKLTASADEERAGFTKSLEVSLRYADSLQAEILRVTTDSRQAIECLERSLADSGHYVGALQGEIKKLQGDACASLAAFEESTADAKRYAHSLEAEIGSLTNGVKEERAAFEVSRAQSKEYVEALEHEVGKVTLASNQERASFEKALAVSSAYVESLQQEIARLIGPSTPNLPS